MNASFVAYTIDWYLALIKPFFTPPAVAIAAVWAVLYIVIALSFGFVFIRAFKKQLLSAVWLPFAVNLFFNLLYAPLWFGLKNNGLAFVNVLLVLVTLVWAMRKIWPVHRWVAWVNLPYLLWVMFAAVLQLGIALLNG